MLSNRDNMILLSHNKKPMKRFIKTCQDFLNTIWKPTGCPTLQMHRVGRAENLEYTSKIVGNVLLQNIAIKRVSA